jgi:hypothetical protein
LGDGQGDRKGTESGSRFISISRAADWGSTATVVVCEMFCLCMSAQILRFLLCGEGVFVAMQWTGFPMAHTFSRSWESGTASRAEQTLRLFKSLERAKARTGRETRAERMGLPRLCACMSTNKHACGVDTLG